MFFSLYSKLMWIPFTFTPVMLGGGGGQIESGTISIWRKIGFKMTQILFACQALFVAFRTLEYMRWGDAGFFGEESKENVNLNWDFVPIMVIFATGFMTYDVNAYFIFDVGRELNRKVFNEFIRLRGKIDEQRNNYVVKY